MRISQQRKADNKARVLDAALTLFSRRGFADVAVSELMAEAGLTHGGFYNHFNSKAALEKEACALAFDRAVAAVAEVAATPRGEARRQALRLYVERYLSERARDARGAKCPMVAFSAEVSRESPGVQARFALGVAAYLDTLARAMETDQAKATTLLSELVGALTLARSVAASDLGLSNAILAAARERILEALARAAA